MGDSFAALGPFIDAVLKGLEQWTIRNVAFLAVVTLGVNAAVAFAREAWKKTFKRDLPAGALQIAPLAAGIAMMFSIRPIMEFSGFPFPETTIPQKIILGIGIGIVATAIFRMIKRFRKWRAKGK